MGRPITNNSPEAKKRRERQRKWYRSKSKAERQEIVQSRDKEAQRRADEKRDRKKDPERQQQHNRLVARAKKAHPEKERARRAAQKTSSEGKKCSVCGATDGLERHHLSYGDNARWVWRCPKHNPRGGAA